jgi:hypothetical protein
LRVPGFQKYIYADAAPSRAAAALSPFSIPADKCDLGCAFIHGSLILLGLSHFHERSIYCILVFMISGV